MTTVGVIKGVTRSSDYDSFGLRVQGCAEIAIRRMRMFQS